MPEVAQECQIQAPAKLVFDAFVRASDLREWLCDQAYSDPKPQGRYWLRWRNGPRVEGHYVSVKIPAALSFTWREPEAPGQTTVRISLEEAGQNTRLSLVHSGFGAGADWESYQARCTKLWTDGLQNLKSVLETGLDLRRAQRPYLGVRWRFMDHGGIQILEVVGGNGADVSVLQAGDVITAIGECPVADYETLLEALEGCEPKSQAELLVIRDGQEIEVSVLLGAVPRAEMSLDPPSILAGVRDRQIRAQRLLSDTLLGTTEAEASLRPEPDAWSVKEILAHLSITERNLHHRLWQIVMRGWDDTPQGDPALLPEAIAAAMTRTDTLPRLLDRFAQDQAETLAFFTALRPAITENKARWRRLAEALDLSEHTRQHIDQIVETLKVIRARRKVG